MSDYEDWEANFIDIYGRYPTAKDAWNRRSPAGAPAGVPSLSELNELAKVYASSYASPHHITFTVEGLRALLGSVHQAAPQTSEPKGVHSGEAPASAPLAGGSAE